MIIYRCDVCSKEVTPEQPRVYPLAPEGWFAVQGVVELEGQKRPRLEAPHACSVECVKVLNGRKEVGPTVQIQRPFWRKEGFTPKGSANCKQCAKIGVGKTCVWHGVKQDGWPAVASVRVAK